MSDVQPRKKRLQNTGPSENLPLERHQMKVQLKEIRM